MCVIAVILVLMGGFIGIDCFVFCETVDVHISFVGCDIALEPLTLWKLAPSDVVSIESLEKAHWRG